MNSKINITCLTLVAILVMMSPIETFAQGEITGFKAELTRNDRSQPIVEIKPNVYDMAYGAKKNTKRYGVWGVLICYSVNGERKSARQDMTTNIMDKGVYTYTLAYAQNAKVTGVEIEYFDATKPSHTYPKKSSCY